MVSGYPSSVSRCSKYSAIPIFLEYDIHGKVIAPTLGFSVSLTSHRWHMLGFKVILCRFQAVWRLYPALSEFINSKFYSPVSLLHHALPQLFTVSLYLPHRILTLGNICENLEGPGYQHKSFGFLSDLPPTKNNHFLLCFLCFGQLFIYVIPLLWLYGCLVSLKAAAGESCWILLGSPTVPEELDFLCLTDSPRGFQ